MSGFDARLERLELKYLIDEAKAERLRQAILPWCEPDVHSAEAMAAGERGYAITSLYLDSPGLAFHQAKERGEAERVKLRVRTYDDGTAETPAVLEVKRRSADIVDKTRARVPRDRVQASVGGAPVSSAASALDVRGTDAFALLAAQHGAEPSLRVRYRREAWVSTADDYARVTFDREIEAQRASTWSLTSGRERWVAFDDHWQDGPLGRRVVLEIKCHATVPFWLSDLIREHGLRRSSFSKYSIGIHLTGRAMGVPGLMRRSAKVMA